MSVSAVGPRVSCLLVTADRPHLLRRALLSYREQTYPNKELIVLDNGTSSIEHLLEDIPAEERVYLRREKKAGQHIGALRNVALEAASGDYVAPQWDDDDWSHPERLARQIEAMLKGGYDACTLTGTLMHVDDERFFEHPFIGRLAEGVPPTIVHRRDAKIRYPNLRRTSDTAYLKAWRAQSHVQLPLSEAHLYIRYSHGDNLWEPQHFLRRMRNTPGDLAAYAWFRYVRGNLFAHPRFRLSEEAQAAFALYLKHSRELGLWRAHQQQLT